MEHSQEQKQQGNVKQSKDKVTTENGSSLQELFNYMRVHAEEQKAYFFRSDDDADDFLASE